MNNLEIHDCPNPSQPLGLGSSDQLGPLPETQYTLVSGGSITWTPAYSADQVRAYAAQERAAERERIGAAVTRCTLLAEDCEGDSSEVDTARKALACTILAAIAGYEAPAPAGTQQGLFGAQPLVRAAE